MNRCTLRLFKKSDRLLKIRITTYISMFTFLAITALTLLNLDFERYDDREIQMYARSKWKLITTWFNLVILAYLPLSAYCDWRELQKKETLNHVEKLNIIRTHLFTNIILPTTAVTKNKTCVIYIVTISYLVAYLTAMSNQDTLFWGLWNYNKSHLMPVMAENVVSIWSQHAMHTMSLIFVIFDLIVVPRERPKNMSGIITMFGFISLYMATCVQGIWNEEYMYPCFKTFSTLKLCLLSLYVYTCHLFFYLVQWLVVDTVWPPQPKIVTTF